MAQKAALWPKSTPWSVSPAPRPVTVTRLRMICGALLSKVTSWLSAIRPTTAAKRRRGSRGWEMKGRDGWDDDIGCSSNWVGLGGENRRFGAVYNRENPALRDLCRY